MAAMIIDRLVEPLLLLPRIAKRLIAVTLDIGLCVLTVWLAFYLRLNVWVPLSGQGWPAAVASVAIALPIFVVSGLYRAIFRFVSWEALAAITQAVLIYGIIYSAIFTAFGIEGVPRTVGIIQPILLFMAVASSRAFARYLLGGRYRRWLRRSSRRNVLIYGAGPAGRQLAGALDDNSESRLVGFIDDERNLHGSSLGGVRVWGGERLAALVARFEVDEIFLAMPAASRDTRNEILGRIRETGVAVRTLPDILDIAHGKVTVNDLRPLEVDDILGREAVAPDSALLEVHNRGKTVLVTGAGGSIGSELCRQILATRPARLLLLEATEYALYAIHGELLRAKEADPSPVEILPLLGSVCDELRMRRIFAVWRPDTVYHAAAYKHVPLVEHNPVEGVRNNVLGTLVCARFALEFGCAQFVLISTDKAVRPTNIMGASKRLAEMILQGLASEAPATCFCMVRFGNVLDSSGSVVPLFRQQIGSGGPVTVTHREITRYFMTIPEASQLVLQAGAMAQGGEVFVLDMGDPVKVHELAVRMIELSGLRVKDESNPDGDIAIEFTGLRPGEKLYEELLIGENPVATAHPRVMMARESHPSWPELETRLAHLRQAIEEQDARQVGRLLAELVADYAPAAKMVDWVLLEAGKEQEGLRRDLRSSLPRYAAAPDQDM